MRQVSIKAFSGPLDLLLKLIEDQQLDITQVSLAAVTEQYLSELQKLEQLPADELADFLVVAAKLVYIKSKLMIPTAAAEDEDVGTDLERQLRMYKAFVEAARDVARLWNRRKPIYPRDGYAHLEPIFNPPAGLVASDLRAIMADILRELEPITRLPQTVLIRTINIRQTIARIRDQLIKQRRARFHQMLAGARNRTEAIVTFLAMLELVKQRTVTVQHIGQDGDIEIVLLEEAPAVDAVAMTEL